MSGRKKKTNRLVPEVPAQSGNGERDFLEDYDAAGFHHPSVAVDVAAMTAAGGSLHVLLVRRSEHPHKGRWALVGGFAGMRESLDAAASRVLEAKAGLRGIFLEQLYSFGAPDRDPRTRIISVAYYALVVADRLRRACRGREDVVLARLAVSGRGEEVRRVRTLNDAGHELLLAFDHG